MRASPCSDVSSSQSGMADNETDSRIGSSPPKKKRTRTLTTPHQSAVLHALLAKSRFPTTAMREEVGRQIGLSARKVQIWFQNQRQKARRPQSESAPLSRPPQFGPFPIMTTAGPSQVSPSDPGSARSAGSLDSTSSLSGPGIPGWSHQRRHSSAGERDPPSPATPLALPHPLSDVPARPTAAAAPLDTSPRSSRRLPPINFRALETRSTPLAFPQQLPLHNHPSSPRSLAIPPPFALQPQPQWDPHTFTPFTRPEFASWSHPSGSARYSFSAVGAHDRGLSPRARHFYTSSEPRHTRQLDSPLPHHIIPPSRPQRHSSPFSSFPSAHARSDDDL